MTHGQPLPRRRSIFRDDEPVIQSQPLLPGGVSPRFGDTHSWDMNGVIRRPANLDPTNWKIPFHGLRPEWNLMARETAMIWLNPRHPAVLACGIHLSAAPRKVTTIRPRMGAYRAMATFGSTRQLPADVTRWSDDDFKQYIAHRCEINDPGSGGAHVAVIRALHQLRQALACGGLQKDPWPGMTVNQVLGIASQPTIKTPAIPPEVWFPLVRAAWTYISVFAPDLFRAQESWQEVKAKARRVRTAEANQLFEAWLSNPDSRVPLHADDSPHAGAVNWNVLSWMIGIHPKALCYFTILTSTGRARRAAAEQLVSQGRTQGGLLNDLVEVDRPDGSRGPWHPALSPQELWMECNALRAACYAFVAALSMMRDSEIREIAKGSTVEYFSTPAVKSTKQKGDADLPTKHWWLIEPAVQAIDTAARLSFHDELAFGSLRSVKPDESFDSADVLEDFINRVNLNCHVTGLAKIPSGKVLPHMFRKTMAMLTHDFPGSEIAVGMQLKHVATRALANRTTQGYMEKDNNWAKHFDQALADRRFERLRELFDADTRGETIGYGPGADRMREAFAAVRKKAEHLRETGQARRGDIRVEHGLLRRTRFTIRFGKLNHCTMNDDDPTGAKCLEDAIVPQGHRGPLPDRCRPSRCGNSIIGPEHLPIWRAEHTSLTQLRATPKLPPGRKALLDEELRDVEIVLKRVDEA
ncbi:hypothetical protein [Streptomyces sp. NPDC058869]|uniref:hypothetical protein n=1 Tax=Streptomyces sp. NPDC058869 TaxID=3346659 RepID=UPI0036763CB9